MFRSQLLALGRTGFRFPVVAASSGLALLLAGCGAQIGSGDTANAEDAADLPEGAVAEIAEMVPQAVSEDGTFVVASEIYPPGVIVPDDGSAPSGFEISTAQEIATIFGLEYQPEIIPFDSIIPSLQANRYEAAIGEIALNEERVNTLTFVQNRDSKDGFLVAADSDITELEDQYSLCGMRLSALVGSVEETRAKDIAAMCEEAGEPALTVTTYKDQAAADLAVETGREDISFSSSTQAAYNGENSDGRLRFVEQPWTIENYGTGVVIADTDYQEDMAAAVEAALDHMIENGRMAEINEEFAYGLGGVGDAVTFAKGTGGDLTPVVQP